MVKVVRQKDIQIIWEGTNGDTFHLHGKRRGAEGVWLESTEGLYFSPFQVRTYSAARQHGATLGSTKYEPRLVDMHLYMAALPRRTIHMVEEHFWQSWDPERQGRLIVKSASGTRWLYLRLEREPKIHLERDPHHRGVLEVDLTAIAGVPWFTGGVATTTPTVSGKTYTFRIDNPTDLPAYPRFVFDRYSGGLLRAPSGEQIQIATPVPAQGYTVDTNPLHETITMADGTSGYRLQVGAIRTPIPGGTFNVPYVFTDASAVSRTITAEVDLNFRRPW